jgi:hypothetical protein
MKTLSLLNSGYVLALEQLGDRRSAVSQQGGQRFDPAQLARVAHRVLHNLYVLAIREEEEDAMTGRASEFRIAPAKHLHGS